VLEPLKREFTVDEIGDDPWSARAAEAGLSLDEFAARCNVPERSRVIGRFSTFWST